MEIENKHKTIYRNQHITPGTKVICVKPVDFVDGTSHNVGDILVVTEDTLSYYRSFIDIYYKVISNQTDE